MLLAVPNVSEGRDAEAISAMASAFGRGVALLDTHVDPVHNRSVFTLAGRAGELAPALLEGARVAVASIDMRGHEGAHPCIGALDVCPVVWLEQADRDAAIAESRAVASTIATELSVPVFLYGDLATSGARRERAFFRNGGLPALARRVEAGELDPDLGPDRPHPSAGATLVTARPPLAAFNVELDTDDVDVAVAVAARLRESGGGLPGVRAIGLRLVAGRTQISTNVHDPVAIPLARVLEEVRSLAAAHGAEPIGAELVGLVPEAALEGFPESVRIEGFDSARQVIERRLAGLNA